MDTATYLICFGAVLLGTSVQGTVGFGYALVSAPIVSAVYPEFVPGGIIALGLVLSTTIMLRDRIGLRLHDVPWAAIGLVPGSILGAWIVTVIPREYLVVAVAAGVIIAVVLSVTHLDLHPDRHSLILAGLASGTFGTATSIGGPPLVIVYQHEEGPALRSTLATLFLLTGLLGVGALSVAGEFTTTQLGQAALLTPAVIAGASISALSSRRVDGKWLRPAVLSFAVVSSLFVASLEVFRAGHAT